MLWNTIATGHHPAEHGVIGFTEFNIASQRIQPISSRSRRVKALWNIISQEGKRAHVFGWFASHPAERINGVCVAETFAKFKPASLGEVSPVPEGSVHPPETAERLAELRVSPDDVDKNLLHFFIPRINEVDLARDKRPFKLLKHLSELYTLHNAAIDTLESEPESDFLAIYYHFIDWVCHDFMAYGAPQRPGVLDWDFAIYSEVVERAYELQDLLLRDLARRAGPDATYLIVSDHGFLSGEDRPVRTPRVTAGIAAWHRREGLFVMAGRGIAPGVKVEGARLFDVAPTLLHAMGLPIGDDMRGRVLEQVFEDPKKEIQRIPSWESHGAALATFTGDALSGEESAALLRQFADLGYVELKDDPFESAEWVTRRENAWNLGQALLNDDRTAEALPLLEEAWWHNPEQAYLALPLARCQARLGLVEEAAATAATLRDFAGHGVQMSLLLADIHREVGNYKASERELDAARSAGADSHQIELQRGLLRLHEERFAEAETLFRRHLETDTNGEAQLGLVRALVRQDKHDQAENLVCELTVRLPHDANVWFTLGQVRQAQGKLVEAKEAFAQALAIRPGYLNVSFNLTQAERETNLAAGGPRQFMTVEHDFSDPESRADRVRRENAERLAGLRAESAKRRAAWQAVRDEQRTKHGAVAVWQCPSGGKESGVPTEPITIVSGLPRSGTSLMMQILITAGLEPKVDEHRPADENNPRGYFEWEPVKRLAQDPTCIDQAAGKVVKVVSSQIVFLPRGRNYRIIWMNRSIEEVSHSQRAMLARLSPGHEAASLGDMAGELGKHGHQVLQGLESGAAEGMLSLLKIDYRTCLQRPTDVSTEIAGFLNMEATQVQRALTESVNSNLYRSRLRLT